eukprot:GHVQ01007016.1.p1 GENE.GHVQ01007016.1~~GHVQ01007016.1.p1  ORF type:complete len:137 (+),score=8.96 GHVQ01007016.1:481-891(+)
MFFHVCRIHEVHASCQPITDNCPLRNPYFHCKRQCIDICGTPLTITAWAPCFVSEILFFTLSSLPRALFLTVCACCSSGCWVTLYVKALTIDPNNPFPAQDNWIRAAEFIRRQWFQYLLIFGQFALFLFVSQMSCL